MTINCWEVLVNWTGDGPPLSHFGYYDTKDGAIAATKKFERLNKYHPSWRIEEKVITIE